MSDDIEKVKSKTATSAPPAPETHAFDGSVPAKPNRKSMFSRPHQDLSKALTDALNTWEALTEENDNKLSPEEEQLREVKRLLGELKAKLNEFND